jgi:hypothetical protein
MLKNEHNVAQWDNRTDQDETIAQLRSLVCDGGFKNPGRQADQDREEGRPMKESR